MNSFIKENDSSLPQDMLDFINEKVSWDEDARGPKENLVKVFKSIWTDLGSSKQSTIEKYDSARDKVNHLIQILKSDKEYQTQLGEFIQQFNDEDALRKKQEYLQSFQGQQDMETLSKVDAKTSFGAASHNTDVQRALDDVNRWNQLNNTNPGDEQTQYNLQRAQAKLQSLMATAVTESADLTRIKTLTSRLLNK